MRRIALVAALALICASAWSKRYDIQYGPWVTGVTETSFTVLWTTTEDNLSVVELAPDDGTAFESSIRRGFVQSVAGRNLACRYHCVRVSGLEPGMSYRYRIKGRVVKDGSDPYGIVYGRYGSDNVEYRAHTLDAKADSCSFSMVNDMHFNASRYTALLKGRDRANTDFLLLCGDIVSHSQCIDSVVKYTFGPAAGLLAETPVVFARGNHESRGADFAKVPALFPSTTGEFYHTFRQGPVAFVVLDGGEDKPDSSVEYSGYAHFDEYRAAELEWLKAAVADPGFADAPVKIAVLHIPPLGGKSAWYAQRWLHENVLPVLNGAGVDLMLSAHRHRHSFTEAGKDGNAFPIVVNSNTERLDVTATAGSISLRFFNEAGNETHNYEIDIR